MLLINTQSHGSCRAGGQSEICIEPKGIWESNCTGHAHPLSGEQRVPLNNPYISFLIHGRSIKREKANMNSMSERFRSEGIRGMEGSLEYPRFTCILTMMLHSLASQASNEGLCPPFPHRAPWDRVCLSQHGYMMPLIVELPD